MSILQSTMTLWIVLLFIIVIGGFVILYLTLQKSLTSKTSADQEIEDVVNKVFGMSVGKIAAQSKQILQSEKENIKVDLDNKQRVIEKLVVDLQKDLADRQKEIRVLEQDRVKKFAEITSALSEHRELTKDLKTSTEQLAKVLSNNQSRGEWGERIIEDLMQANGLVEGVHYLRQTKLGTTTLKPDITLLLPNKRLVAVDVKFPYQEIQKMSVAETKKAKEDHLKQFGLDLKTKINKVAEYIKPEEDTLDYAILFVPNEMVFSFINQQFSNLVDYALAKRIILVSPFTFLIVARTVMESYRNFMIGDKLKEVVKYVDDFVQEWGKFREEFDKFGRSIDTLKGGYEKITETRAKQMERKIEKIEAYRQGSTNLLDDKKPVL